MKRIAISPRPDWEQKVESVGVTYHHTEMEGGERKLYWDESAAYEFTAAEIDELEKATNELQTMAIGACQYIIDKNLFSKLAIPDYLVPIIKNQWDKEPPAVYGRMDFSWDGKGPPKLLEYNADTPTALVEAAVAQWFWVEDLKKGDQFNSIHDKLVAKWKDIKPYLTGSTTYFVHADNRDTEDLMTTNYMREVAIEAGVDTKPLLINQIGWDSSRYTFVDQDELEMLSIFKLYPWEWIINEPFGQHVISNLDRTQWIEPIWKMMLSNKGILPILWELNPGHPNLLPAFFDLPPGMQNYAKKPILGREGGSVTLMQGFQTIASQESDYGEEGYVYQERHDLPNFDGFYPCIGSWVIDQESAGIGIREDAGLITSNYSRFVPHYFK